MIIGTNIFYISNFNVIGGTEQFIYELTRKYKDLDITVLYKTGHWKQIERIAKNVRIIKYKGQKIKCKKFFCNYETDIIDNVEAEEYTQIVHAMFKTNRIHPRVNKKITQYFAVSEIAAQEWEELTGIHAKVVRNPLQVLEEEKKPILFLVSATRLTPEKGKNRMEKLGNMLNKKGIEYLWLIFTNDDAVIDNPNIVYIKPRLSVRKYLSGLKATGNVYGVQLSDCEGDCYFTRECEALGIPVLGTPIASFKEQNLIDGKNCYYLPFDMKDIDIDKIVNNIPKYDGYIRNDTWRNELVDVKSNYEEEEMKVKVKCTYSYDDVELGRTIKLGEEYIVDKARADVLLANPYHLVELVEYIEEPKVEKAVLKPKTEKATKPRKK